MTSLKASLQAASAQAEIVRIFSRVTETYTLSLFPLFRFHTQTPQPNTLLTLTYTRTQTRISQYRSPTSSPHVCSRHDFCV